MTEYAAAGEWLDAYGRAWMTFDGDAWVGLFTDDAEYHEDPFGVPLVGHNALRAYLLEAAASERGSSSRSSAIGSRARPSSRPGTRRSYGSPAASTPGLPGS